MNKRVMVFALCMSFLGSSYKTRAEFEINLNSINAILQIAASVTAIIYFQQSYAQGERIVKSWESTLSTLVNIFSR